MELRNLREDIGQINSETDVFWKPLHMSPQVLNPLASDIIAGNKGQNSHSDDGRHEDVIHIAIPRTMISILLISE